MLSVNCFPGTGDYAPVLIVIGFDLPRICLNSYLDSPTSGFYSGCLFEWTSAVTVFDVQTESIAENKTAPFAAFLISTQVFPQNNFHKCIVYSIAVFNSNSIQRFMYKLYQ